MLYISNLITLSCRLSSKIKYWISFIMHKIPQSSAAYAFQNRISTVDIKLPDQSLHFLYIIIRCAKTNSRYAGKYKPSTWNANFPSNSSSIKDCLSSIIIDHSIYYWRGKSIFRLSIEGMDFIISALIMYPYLILQSQGRNVSSGIDLHCFITTNLFLFFSSR